MIAGLAQRQRGDVIAVGQHGGAHGHLRWRGRRRIDSANHPLIGRVVRIVDDRHRPAGDRESQSAGRGRDRVQEQHQLVADAQAVLWPAPVRAVGIGKEGRRRRR